MGKNAPIFRLEDLPANFRARNREELAELAGESSPYLPRNPTAPNLNDAKAEKVLQGQCESDLHTAHTAYLHLSFRAREKVGWPDLVFVWFGWPLAVELKSMTGTLSTEQEDMLTQMHKDGWHCYVLRTWFQWREVLTYYRERPRKDPVPGVPTLRRILPVDTSGEGESSMSIPVD